MGSWSVPHWIIVLIVVALVFGTKKLRSVGEDLGAAIRGFKEGMKAGGEQDDGEKRRIGETARPVENEHKSS